MNRIYQIYFNEESKKNCYQWSSHYYNNPDNRFDMAIFENRVILELIENNDFDDNDYIAILSHKFKALRNTNPILKNSLVFNEASIEQFIKETGADVISFFGTNKTKNILLQSQHNHAKTPFIQALDLVFKKANIDFDVLHPQAHRFYIMRNAFIARNEIYKRYVSEMLRPCVDAMRDESDTELQNLLFHSANYSLEAMRFRQNPKLKQFFTHYPLHPFLLERLPSIWLTINTKIKCEHW
jgi:hypothetical protein